MVDYMVIGLGLAGISFCEILEKKNKSFIVFTDDSQVASNVAGGLYNPVILKRFSLAWNAGEQLQSALPFYNELEQKLKVKLDFKIPVLRLFASVNEQNLWFQAADKPNLSMFLHTRIHNNTNAGIKAPYGYGEVLHTGRIDTKKLIASYTHYLLNKAVLKKETFDFALLSINEDYVTYKGVSAKQLVFATGYGLKNNPFFNYLPLNGTKGELLTIKAPSLKESNIIKSSVFIIPLQDDLYRIGATYKWKDKTNTPTPEARTELLEKLDRILECKYEVVQHVAGIRPTVADRRPLVGRHPKYSRLYILNGFGSRGVMIAPYASEQLYNYIHENSPLNAEMDSRRYDKKYLGD